MRKLFLLLIVVAFLLISLALYLFFFPKNTLSESGEEEVFDLPFEIPFLPSGTEESTSSPDTGGGGMGIGGEEGGGGVGGEEEVGPKVNYNLTVDSIPSNLTIYVEYYIGNTLLNTTQATPFSVEAEEGTTACVVEISGYEGIFWLLDDIGCNFADCGEYDWGCAVLMDGNHEAVLRQYS